MSPDGVRFRPAAGEDVEAVLAFWQVAAEDAGRPPDSPSAIRRVLERDPAALELAVDDDGVVGTLILGWDGWRCHLFRLAVHPRCRRRGLARELVARAEQRMRALGVSRMDAMVLDANPDAHALWQAMGYRAQADWSRWVKPL